MKDIILRIFSFILTIALISGIIFFGWIIYEVVFDSDQSSIVRTGDSLISNGDSVEVTTEVEKKSIGDTIGEIFTKTTNEPVTYSSEESAGKYFYEQLNENQKIIYNGLQESKEKMISGTYTIQFGNKFADTLSKEDGSKVLGDDYQSAVEAFTHDNPDLFYVDISKLYLNIETQKRAFNTTYNVYIGPTQNNNYFSKGFSSENDVKNALAKISQEKNKVKSKLTGDTYKDIKIIHDYLVDEIDYDQNNQSSGTYTIYGALVEKKCVCEGYTRAFKYLADMAGIDCLLMQGEATNTDGTTESHAWNAVYVKNAWYLIDTTWYDPIIVGRGIVLNSTHYKYFLKGTDTFNKDHKLDTQFSEGGKIFSYPQISKSDYR